MAQAIKQRSANYKWVMLFMVVLMYIFTYAYASTSLSALLPQISKELGLDAIQQAAAVGALPIGIACFTFIAGILLDKFSTRFLVCFTIAFCAVAILLRGFITSFGMFYAVMFMLGIGQGIVFPGAVKVVTTWFKREELFRANGIVISGAPIGMIAGFNLAIPLSNAMGGWQNMYRLIGILGLVVAVAWLIVARDLPADQQVLNQQLGMQGEKNSVLENLKAVLSKKQAWFLVLAESFMNGMIQTILAFGATVLGTFPGATAQLAATTSSMGNLGSLFGYYILPPISDRFGVRKPFVMAAMVFYSVMMPLAFMSKNFLICGTIFFIASFFNGWSNTGSRSMLQETPGLGGLRAGTANGFMNTMSRLFAAFLPMVFASISLITGIIPAMCIVSALGFVAVIFIALSKETGIGREEAKRRLAEKKTAKLGK